jgi:hypothetical protein
LADVSSLANAQGGDLVFGVEDADGIATAIPGVDPTNQDAAILRLENILRDGIEPRLSVRVHWILLSNGRGALVIRVPGSLAAPHRVIFKNSGRFFNRNSRGKYEMNVHELRHAFTQSEELPQRLRQLHNRAVENAVGVDFPVRVCPVPTAVISIMPLGFLRERRDLNVTKEDTLYPVQTGQGNWWVPTLEGGLWHSTTFDDNLAGAYTLTHRTGRIDAAWPFGAKRTSDFDGEAMMVFAAEFEAGLGDMASNGVVRLQSYGLEGPWVLMVTMLNLKGSRLVRRDARLTRPAWQDKAQLPELIVERVTPEVLVPLYKACWLLFGMTRPNDFDANKYR